LQLQPQLFGTLSVVVWAQTLKYEEYVLSAMRYGTEGLAEHRAAKLET